MNWAFLALFKRSLQGETRLLRTHGFRLGLVTFLLFMLMAAHQSMRFMGAPGLTFFRSAMFVNMFFITFIGLNYFGSAITEEKEAGTLGLVKMTSLNSIAIILGKAGSRFLGMVQLLLVQFPFTLLAIALGGVSLAQVVAAYVSLLAFMVFLCGLGLLASVILRNTRQATSVVLLSLVLIFLVPFIIQAALTIPFGNPGGGMLLAVVNKLVAASPVYAMVMIMKTGFKGGIFSFQVISNIIAGLVFFGLGWWGFEYFTRNTKKPAASRGLIARKGRGMRRLFGLGRPWRLALGWKDFHFQAGGRTLMLVKALLVIIVLIIVSVITDRSSEMRQNLAATLTAICIPAALLEMAFFAARTFNEEMKWRTLAGLVILPRSKIRLVLDKLAGGLAAASFWVVCLGIGFFIHPKTIVDATIEPLFSIGGAVAAVVYICLLHWIMYLSLRLKRGALLVGGFTFYLLSAVFWGLLVGMMFSSRGNFEVLLAGVIFVYSVTTCILWFAIGRQLTKACLK